MNAPWWDGLLIMQCWSGIGPRSAASFSVSKARQETEYLDFWSDFQHVFYHDWLKFLWQGGRFEKFGGFDRTPQIPPVSTTVSAKYHLNPVFPSLCMGHWNTRKGGRKKPEQNKKKSRQPLKGIPSEDGMSQWPEPNHFYLDLKHVHKYGSAKFQPNPLFSSQQMAIEHAESVAEEKKQTVGKPIGDPVGTGCPNEHYILHCRYF